MRRNWAHAAKGLVRASVDSNHPKTVSIAQLSKSEQIKNLCAAAGGPDIWNQTFNYILEDFVKMPGNCCKVEVFYQDTQLQKNKKTMAESLLGNGPDHAAVRQYIYSGAAGRLLLSYSMRGWFACVFSSGPSQLIQSTLLERYEQTTKDGTDENHTSSRSFSPARSTFQGKASSHKSLQNPGKIHGSLLHAAARHGCYAMLGELLDEGADVNLSVEPPLTALHAAASSPHYSCLLLLLDRGADIHAASPKHGGRSFRCQRNRICLRYNQYPARKRRQCQCCGWKNGCADNAAISNGNRAALSILIVKCPDLTVHNE